MSHSSGSNPPVHLLQSCFSSNSTIMMAWPALITLISCPCTNIRCKLNTCRGGGQITVKKWVSTKFKISTISTIAHISLAIHLYSNPFTNLETESSDLLYVAFLIPLKGQNLSESTESSCMTLIIEKTYFPRTLCWPACQQYSVWLQRHLCIKLILSVRNTADLSGRLIDLSYYYCSKML